MEQGKCCIKCGITLEESNDVSSGYKSDENCKILLDINEEQLKSKLNISETNSSEHQTESNNKDSGVMLNLENALLKSNANTYGKIQVANSKNVIIGNVTYITGPIHVTQISTQVEEQNVTNQLLLNDPVSLNIISRESWMAKPPKFITPLPGLAKYVIIAHTATEDGYTQSQNALLVKLIQDFHMESRNWDDIAYNFLVGCDGNVYEGRKWNIQGSHTYGYNKKSICIAFIGCFMDHLPPASALKAARKLINEGVRLGFIPEDYTLAAHCQCTSLESPGVQLFNEIKTWPRWRELTPEDSK